ncbi:MAG: M48 family metalloprotease [Nitriliruptorales bacterium]|nr:M48 family metalloprotease [Nitriliruptorales bacterium]
MTLVGRAPEAGTVARRPAWPLLLAHLAALAVVVAGVGAQIFRPLAPDLGPAPDGTTFFTPAFLGRVEAYRAPLRAVALASLLIGLAAPASAALTPWGRRMVNRVVERIGLQRPARAATIVALGVVVLADLCRLPLSFWAGFVHEGAWGFRTQDLAGWARDWLVGRGTSWLAVALLVAGGVTLVRRLPRAWPPVAGLAATGLTVLLALASPLVMEPLWFRLAPLPEGPLRAEVETVLARAGDPVNTILVADASRRTTKENAYVSGLRGTRRVVLYDTLIASRSPDEVGVIVAHELGHDRHGDLLRGVLLGGAGTVTLAYALAALLRVRVRFGRQAGQADPRVLPAVLLVVALLHVTSLPVANLVSRDAEAAADLASLQYTEDVQAYITMHYALAEANLGDPWPPRWAHLLWRTHPTAVERLEMGRRYALFGPGLGVSDSLFLTDQSATVPAEEKGVRPR